MKYLFCTDGSKVSFSALEGALRLVKNGFTVDVFFLREEENVFKKLYNPEIELFDFEETIRIVKEIIDKHAHFFGESFIREGDVEKVIEHLENNFYNMVILGSNNYKGLSNKFFSFARKVLEQAHCSTFIFRGQLQENALEERKKFLLCIDNTYETLNAVISFMKNFDTNNDINLITVSADFFQHPLEISLSGNYVEEILEKEALVSRKNLDEIESILCHNGVNIKSKIHLRGNPSEEILNFVKQDFDLIVLGSHSREGLVDFLVGSVSKSILDYSTLPVLIVPTK